ncbi:hypothetical protein VB620_19865 [Nodularia harveyana UHCC-0300]|uniref:Lipoprotein n=1 Tax=Nodularia harveyana UHCC-0300 TaxID=2974287 RepID=A0ABU5UJ40_9CYAN|nr:hypothetical protein [Nodularia harveyana]MEA5583586.1 hypothetical protein [Nodularia harveyana UHCC-0300]
MNKLIPTIALIISSLLITSCANSPSDSVNEIPSNTVETTETEPTPGTSTPTDETTPSQGNNGSQAVVNNEPEVVTVKELVTGDISCYATIVDEQGKEKNVGASFEICADADKYLNKKVRASYEIASLNDCESIEPCGKTRQESIISEMEILEDTSSTETQSSNTSKFTNGKWTITIGNRNSWDGVNNTGNVSYKGCDDQGNCIDLTGGKVSCRRGECVMGWVNGDYRYIWSTPITEDGTGSPTLIVQQGGKEILNATGFKHIPIS